MYLTEGKAESYSAISRPIILNIEDASVTLHKTIYNGTWLYTSVSAIPLDSSTYLLPGDAQLSDSAKYFYKENTSKKEQSFLQVSKKDGKQLLVVYIYIKEFDEIGACFLDHLQVSESTSMSTQIKLANIYLTGHENRQGVSQD